MMKRLAFTYLKPPNLLTKYSFSVRYLVFQITNAQISEFMSKLLGYLCLDRPKTNLKGYVTYCHP